MFESKDMDGEVMKDFLSFYFFGEKSHWKQLDNEIMLNMYR